MKKNVYTGFIKRFLDVISSTLVMILFCWLYVIIAVLVRIKLGKPILFKQQRPGQKDYKTGEEKLFYLYKFRTMSNAKDSEGNLRSDPERMTRFGHILRSSSLDELPEMWNIFKGDMSLVGPRPWLVSYLKYYTPEERRRHLVKPGLTGWAQVNGRTAAAWGERIKYDIEYVDNISFLLDVKIILMTVKKVLMHSDLVEAGFQGDFDDYRRKQWEEGIVPYPENYSESEYMK